MKKQDMYNIAVTFRAAILKAKHSGKFDRRDRMSNFPVGCCDDSCDLLAHYLSTAYGFHTKQGNGVYCDNTPANTTNHVWLIMNDGTIVDITADQFGSLSGHTDGVYVGKGNRFYECLEYKRIDENYDIMKCDRLWSDYQDIMSEIDR